MRRDMGERYGGMLTFVRCTRLLKFEGFSAKTLRFSMSVIFIHKANLTGCVSTSQLSVRTKNSRHSARWKPSWTDRLHRASPRGQPRKRSLVAWEGSGDPAHL